MNKSALIILLFLLSCSLNAMNDHDENCWRDCTDVLKICCCCAACNTVFAQSYDSGARLTRDCTFAGCFSEDAKLCCGAPKYACEALLCAVCVLGCKFVNYCSSRKPQRRFRVMRSYEFEDIQGVGGCLRRNR